MDAGIITALGAIIGSFVTYLVTQSNNKKELSINHTKYTAEFIDDLQQMLEAQKKETAKLSQEIRELQKVNMQLTMENKKLQEEIEELNNSLNELRESNK